MNKNEVKATPFHHSAHLGEQDLLPLNTSCPFCGSTKRDSSALMQEQPDVHLVYCRNCYAASASKMPKPEALDQYYSQYYDEKEEKITLDEPNRMASHIIHYITLPIGALDKRDISILDYGGGDGTISIRIANNLIANGAKTVTVFLVDYDLSMAESSGQKVQVVRPKDLTEIPSQSMDLVIASAIIEHIPDAKKVMYQLFGAMKFGGVFYARTPYVAPLANLAQLFNSKIDFTYPAHVHDLGAKFWNNIVNSFSLGREYQILRSTPSIVETSFGEHFLRSLAAYILKIPGYIFKESYGLVGGWEVFIYRNVDDVD